MSKKFTGIDIGTCYIKIADIIMDKWNVAISDPHIIKTPGMLIQNGRLAAGDGLLKLISEVLPRRRRHGGKCVVILNDSLLVNRDMELPPAKPAELEKMVRLDVSEYLPSSVEQYTIRYKILVSDKVNPRKNNYILMSAIKNDLVTDFINVFLKAGLKPVAIDTSFNCMAKYLKRAHFTPLGKDRLNTALLDLGAGGTRLIIAKNGIPYFHQVLNYSSQKLDVIISNAVDIERDKAEELKISCGLSHIYTELPDESYRSAGTLISQQMDLLMGDMYKCFQSFSARNDGEAVNEIRLTGGTASLKYIDRYFHQAFDLPCSIEKPEKNIIFKNDIGMKLEYPLFTNLIGAACRG